MPLLLSLLGLDLKMVQLVQMVLFFPPLPLRGFGFPLLLMLVTKLNLLLLGTLQLKELKPVFPMLWMIPLVKSALRPFP